MVYKVYINVTWNYIPFSFDVHLSLTRLTNDHNQQSPNQNHQVNWHAINSEVISHYNALTDVLCSEVHILTASIVCNDGNCSSCTHSS